MESHGWVVGLLTAPFKELCSKKWLFWSNNWKQAIPQGCFHANCAPQHLQPTYFPCDLGDGCEPSVWAARRLWVPGLHTGAHLWFARTVASHSGSLSMLRCAYNHKVSVTIMWLYKEACSSSAWAHVHTWTSPLQHIIHSGPKTWERSCLPNNNQTILSVFEYFQRHIICVENISKDDLPCDLCFTEHFSLFSLLFLALWPSHLLMRSLVYPCLSLTAWNFKS